MLNNIMLFHMYMEGTSWSSHTGKGDRVVDNAGAYIHVQTLVHLEYCQTGGIYMDVTLLLGLRKIDLCTCTSRYKKEP